MRPLKIKNTRSIHRAVRPPYSLISEAGNQGASWQSSLCPEGQRIMSEASWAGTSVLGVEEGSAQIITHFEKFTPNYSSNYKRRLGAQVISTGKPERER